jgi:hypothetical protein
MPEDWLFVDSHCLARKLPKLPKSDGTSSLPQGSLVYKHFISSGFGYSVFAARVKDSFLSCHFSEYKILFNIV